MNAHSVIGFLIGLGYCATVEPILLEPNQGADNEPDMETGVKADVEMALTQTYNQTYK